MMNQRMFSPTARAAIAGFVAVACHRAPPTARDRVLAMIGGEAVTVVVADGRAISHPRLRAVLDAVAVHWPASMGCVLEAAFASDQVAVSIDRGRNVTAIIATAAEPRCAALSKREPGLWIATIGAAAAANAGSVLDDPRFARARPYLQGAPIAGVSLDEPHLLATAQPDPLEAWVAIDAPGNGDAIEQLVAEQVARMQQDAATAAVASRLRASRTGDAQVVVQLDGPVDGDLAGFARTTLAWLDGRARPAAASFRCPPPGTDIACSNGTSYRVAALRTDLWPIVADGRPSPIVTHGLVTGLRLEAAVERLGLAAGDVIVAMGGRLVTTRAMLAERISHARGATTVTIRRGITETVLQFAER